MAQIYANDFYEISDTLNENETLLQKVLELIKFEPMPGKVLEGGNRIEHFRSIITDLANGQNTLDEAFERTEQELPRNESIYSGDNRVFAKGWSERQVRIQFSRFYNQAVLEELKSRNEENCFVPHSNNEDASSKCTQLLAGKQSNVSILYERLIDSYSRGNWSNEVKLPNHPHCTHVVKPTNQ